MLPVKADSFKIDNVLEGKGGKKKLIGLPPLKMHQFTLIHFILENRNR